MNDWFDTSEDAKVAAKRQIEKEFNLTSDNVNYLENCLLDINAMAEEAKQVYEKLHRTVEGVQESRDVGHKSLVKISQEKSNYDALLRTKLEGIQKLESDITAQVREIKRASDTVDVKATDAVSKIKIIQEMNDKKVADFDSQYESLIDNFSRMTKASNDFDKTLTDWIKTTNNNQQIYDKKVIETNAFFNAVKEDQNECKQKLALWSEKFENMCENVKTIVDGKKQMLDTLVTQVAAKVNEVEKVRDDALKSVSNISSKKDEAEKLVAEYTRNVKQFDRELEDHYRQTIENINDLQVEGEAAYSILKTKDEEAREAYETLMRIADERKKLMQEVAETFTKAELVAQNSEQYLKNLEERYINSIKQQANMYEVTESKFTNSASKRYDVLDPSMGLDETMTRIGELNNAYAKSKQAKQGMNRNNQPKNMSSNIEHRKPVQEPVRKPVRQPEQMTQPVNNNYIFEQEQGSQVDDFATTMIGQGYEDYQTDLNNIYTDQNNDHFFEDAAYQDNYQSNYQEDYQNQDLQLSTNSNMAQDVFGNYDSQTQAIEMQSPNDMWDIANALQNQEDEFLLQATNNNQSAMSNQGYEGTGDLGFDNNQGYQEVDYNQSYNDTYGYDNGFGGETNYLLNQTANFENGLNDWGGYADTGSMVDPNMQYDQSYGNTPYQNQQFSNDVNAYEQGYFDDSQQEPVQEQAPQKKGITGSLFGKFKKK